MTIKLELNEQEKTLLLQLIDAAVKAVGINAAEIALHLTKKINEAKLIEDKQTSGDVTKETE